MKYSVKQYAATLLDSLKDKPPKQQNEIIRRFLLALAKNKDWSRLAAILRELEKRYFEQEKLKKVSVETVSPITPHLEKEIKSVFGSRAFLMAKTNSEILGGLKILINDEILIDASAKRQLDNMFSGK